MSKVKIQGNASGTGVVTLTAPNTNTDRTITLPDETVSLTGAPAGLDDVGGVARATSGLLFNGDTATANALNDYEEGTWTATWTDSVLGAIDGGTAAYTKVGNKVTVSAHFSGGSANVSPSGTLSVTGFPFASKNLSGTRYTGILKARKLASAVTKSIYLPYVSSIAYVTDGSTEVGTLSTTAMYTNGSTNERIGFSLTYFTD